MRVSSDFIGASGSGDHEDGDITIDLDLALALRPQEEKYARLDALHVTRREVGRAAAAADVEIGERGARAGHANSVVKPVECDVGSGGGFAARVGTAAAAISRGKAIGDRFRGRDDSSSDKRLGRASQERTSSNTRTGDAAAGAGMEFFYSNPRYRSGGGGSGQGFQRLDDAVEGSSNNSPGTTRESPL